MLTGSIDAWKDFRFCEIFGGGGDAFYKFTPMNQIPCVVRKYYNYY